MEVLKSLNWLDVVAAAILLRAGYLGVKNGLTAELFRFIGTALSLVLAIQWYSQVAEILILNLALPAWLAQFLCFIIITQLIQVIFRYSLIVLLKVLNIQFVVRLEKIGGGIIGLGRGILVAGILILALSFIPSDYMAESIYDKSFSGLFLVKAMERTYKSLTFWMPEDKIEESIFRLPTQKPEPMKLQQKRMSKI